jgi:anaerobic selenocysteine-containing dehydrogenase
MTAANADQWIPIKPGTEGVLALSLAYVIQRRRREDISALEEFAPNSAASVTGVSAGTIQKLAEDLIDKSPSIVIGGGSAAAQTNGSFNLKAVYALNYLVNTPGAKSEEAGVVFNPRPLSYPADFTRSDSLFGDWKTIRDDMSQGKVKVLITRGINPAHGLANIDFREAMNRSDIFITSVSSFMDDTTQMADLILPEHTTLEQWGDVYVDPGPGHQLIAVQQPVVKPRHDTRGFGDILLTLANSLGGKVAQDLSRDGRWNSFRDVVHDGIVELYNNEGRNTRLGDWDSTSVDTFWTSVLQHGGWWDTADIWDASIEGTKTNNPYPLEDLAKEASAHKNPSYAGSTTAGSFYLVPFVSSAIGSGYGANLPWLQGTPDPITSITWITWVEINSKKANELGLSEGDIVTVQGVGGSFEAPLYPHPGVPPDVVCVPFGQGHLDYGRYAQGRGTNVLEILGDAQSEEGALAWASTRVTLSGTGDNRALPKLEGTQLAVDPEPGHIIKIENGHSTEHD